MTINKENYVDAAEEVILSLKKNNNKYILTTSQIRNILSMVNEIYNEAIHLQGDTLTDDLKTKIQYLRMRMAYEAGRDPGGKDSLGKNTNGVHEFIVKKGKLIDNLKTIGNSKENLVLFCHYVEALVAYHKFYGGKEN